MSNSINDLLVQKGAKIGNNIFIGSGLYVDEGYERFLIIEDNVVIAANVSIIVHDSAMNNILGLPIRFGKVVLRANAYIGYGSTILPGVEVGENSLIGASSLVTQDIPANAVAYGSPARVICSIGEYRERFLQGMKNDGFLYMDICPWRERVKKYSPSEESRLFEEFMDHNKECIFPDAPSVVKPGSKVSYRYLIGGWYDIENWPPSIRWMSKNACLFLKNDKACKVLKIKYFNRLCGYLTVNVNKTIASTIKLKINEWDTLCIPVNSVRDTEVSIIKLGVDKTWMPFEIDGNSDNRELGIAIERIWFE
jgi:carbonic anhydrase/acetyltransferase-like protein (isoleucine patch superfamily)